MATTISSYNEGYPHGRGNYGAFSRQPDSYQDSGNYWCDTCDKGFHTAPQLEKHKRAHQKCNIDGCQFIAHPNIITRHIQMQHATGLYKKIAKLSDPEEIKKWREERKKKYPTKENIQKKAAQVKEKVARGEKMGIKDFKRDRKPHNSEFVRKKNFMNYNNRPQRCHEKKPWNEERNHRSGDKTGKACLIMLPPEETRSLKPFGGIQHLIHESDEESEDPVVKDDFIEEDEYVSEALLLDNEPLQTSDTKVCGALSSLIGNYGSSDDEENEDKEPNKEVSKIEKRKETIGTQSSKPTAPDITNTNKTDIDETQNVNVELNKTNELDDDSGPEETKIVKENDKLENNVNEKSCSVLKKEKIKLSVNMKNKRNYQNNSYRRKLPSTLLEKLLHKEIQKERNIVLQCIRYIVQNDYFKSSSN